MLEFLLTSGGTEALQGEYVGFQSMSGSGSSKTFSSVELGNYERKVFVIPIYTNSSNSLLVSSVFVGGVEADVYYPIQSRGWERIAFALADLKSLQADVVVNFTEALGANSFVGLGVYSTNGTGPSFFEGASLTESETSVDATAAGEDYFCVAGSMGNASSSYSFSENGMVTNISKSAGEGYMLAAGGVLSLPITLTVNGSNSFGSHGCFSFYQKSANLPVLYQDNEFPNPKDIFAFGNAGTNSCNVSRGLDSAPFNTPLVMEVTGNDPHLSTYNGLEWNLAPASNGETWQLRVWVKASRNTSIEIFIFGVDSNGGFIGTAGAFRGIGVPVTTEWKECVVEFTFSDPDVAHIQYRLDGTPSNGSGDVIEFDWLQIRKIV